MDIVISYTTALVFIIYSGLVVSFVFCVKQLNTLHALLLILGLVLVAWLREPISHISLPFIILLFLSAYCSIERANMNSIFSKFSFILLACLSLLFATHNIPGFHNALLFSSEHFGKSGLPFYLYANLDKALAALAILIVFKDQILWSISRPDLKFIMLSLPLFFGLCFALGAEFDLKFGALTFAFIFFNLFVTCLAEEAFFRLLIQEKIAKHIAHKYSNYLAVLISAVLFMLAHFHTGEDAEIRMFLIFIAGLGYALVYLRSKSLGSAIAMHFAINIIHFSFFTYPATFAR